MKKKVFYAKKIHTNVLVWISYSFLVFAKPYPHHFAADCYHVEYRYYQEQNQSQSNGGTHGSFLYIGIKSFYKIHVIISTPVLSIITSVILPARPGTKSWWNSSVQA